MKLKIGIELAEIPPGAFSMGSPKEEWGRHAKDELEREISLPERFFIGCCPVTQQQWQQLMPSNPSHFHGDELPVEQITWFEADEFCRKLSERENHACRLPTETEWEYACRAGSTTAFWFGDTITSNDANYAGGFKYGKGGHKGIYRKMTTPVKQFGPNPWGLYDVHGNVRQWCTDWYGNPPGTAAEGEYKILRGGAWNLAPQYGRAANRAGMPPTSRWPNQGMRIVVDA